MATPFRKGDSTQLRPRRSAPSPTSREAGLPGVGGGSRRQPRSCLAHPKTQSLVGRRSFARSKRSSSTDCVYLGAHPLHHSLHFGHFARNSVVLFASHLHLIMTPTVLRHSAIIHSGHDQRSKERGEHNGTEQVGERRNEKAKERGEGPLSLSDSLPSSAPVNCLHDFGGGLSRVAEIRDHLAGVVLMPPLPFHSLLLSPSFLNKFCFFSRSQVHSGSLHPSILCIHSG